MSTYYKAPKPTYNKGQWASYIVARLFIIPIIWDCLRFMMNKLFGGWVGRFVLIAGNNVLIKKIANTKYNHDNWSYYDSKTLIYESVSVETYDGVILDGVEIKNKSILNHPHGNNNYIIKFNGNDKCYEQNMHEMKDDAEALNCNVIGFNYRSVANSNGYVTSSNQLVIDGIAQVQRLLDKGVKSQNITLKGYSLGAGIASLVGYHFHQQGQPINLFNDRSFSSITNVLVGKIRISKTKKGHSETLDRKVLGWLLRPFIWLSLNLTGWEMAAGDAYLAIPRNYREYMVVRSQKEDRTHNSDDVSIPHYASIHRYIKHERFAKKQGVKTRIPNKMQQVITRGDAHLTSAEYLKNSFNHYGDAFFRSFVINAHKDHGKKYVDNSF